MSGSKQNADPSQMSCELAGIRSDPTRSYINKSRLNGENDAADNDTLEGSYGSADNSNENTATIRDVKDLQAPNNYIADNIDDEKHTYDNDNTESNSETLAEISKKDNVDGTNPSVNAQSFEVHGSYNIEDNNAKGACDVIDKDQDEDSVTEAESLGLLSKNEQVNKIF